VEKFSNKLRATEAPGTINEKSSLFNLKQHHRQKFFIFLFIFSVKRLKTHFNFSRAFRHKSQQHLSIKSYERARYFLCKKQLMFSINAVAPMTTTLINHNTKLFYAALTSQIESVSKIEVFLVNFASCLWRQYPNCCKVHFGMFFDEKNLTPAPVKKTSSHQRRQKSASSRRKLLQLSGAIESC
jgi:hypothetical protein